MDTVLGVGQMQVPSQPLGQQGSPSDGESSAFALVHVAPRGCCGAAGHRVRDSTHAPPTTTTHDMFPQPCRPYSRQASVSRKERRAQLPQAVVFIVRNTLAALFPGLFRFQWQPCTVLLKGGGAVEGAYLTGNSAASL